MGSHFSTKFGTNSPNGYRELFYFLILLENTPFVYLVLVLFVREFCDARPISHSNHAFQNNGVKLNKRPRGLGVLLGHLIARQEKFKFKCLLGLKRLGI